MGELLARVATLTNPRGFPRLAADPTRLSGTLVKGFALQHLEDIAGQRHGPDALEPWLASLPPRLKDLATPEAVASVAWVPVELYFSAMTHLVDRFYQGDPRQAVNLGYATAARDIGLIFRTAVRFASPPTVIELSGRVWRSYFDRSQLVLTRKDTGDVEAEVRDWPLIDELSIYEVAGSLMAWMESSKARDFTISRLELLTPNTFLVGAHWQ